ncbi:MCE family protein [Actinomadura sp. GC306]|uniref:MCE family protein n=1 Tax=Actinomadura sp. GC306 TaxID=2530367 RepID=UPI00104C6121|nr:MlaD family protein [Actinomadura sp. GC306]TDC70735.1 MCE family protein [Actinomadura sp. GC306]
MGRVLTGLLTGRRPLAAALAACTLAAGCAALPIGGDAGTYRVTAYFTKAVAFYPESKVRVMGMRVGTVESVTPQQDGRVKVVASVDADVPLPADVRAGIVPLSLIGERTLTFAPAWRPGKPKLADGAVIPVERTEVPVEVDQALKSFTTLLKSFNLADANELLHDGAQSLSGNGTAFNRALQQTADLTGTMAGQDRQLMKVAENLSRLAKQVNGRRRTVTRLIDDFAAVSGALVAERRQIAAFIESLADLVRNGKVLITGYQEELVAGLGTIAEISLVVKGNSAQAAQFVRSIGPLVYGTQNMTNYENRAFTSRVALNNVLRGYLAAALRKPSVDESVPCLPPPWSNCE